MNGLWPDGAQDSPGGKQEERQSWDSGHLGVSGSNRAGGQVRKQSFAWGIEKASAKPEAL